MILTLISGVSGSGKSTALKSLEDKGFFCIDNLPLPLLNTVVQWHHHKGSGARLAISIDARTQHNFTDFHSIIKQLTQTGWQVRLLFLESRDEVLIHRFSETRRTHPLMHTSDTLTHAIQAERTLLYILKENAHIIDTSDLLAQQLRQQIYLWLDLPIGKITLTFQSFGFKYGVPNDIDYLFDVRCLPNPYYDSNLREQTGYDADICHFFAQSESAQKMIADISHFLYQWLPEIENSIRHYVTVGIGCTGGQHRSVYVANALHQQFNTHYCTILRHRQLSKQQIQEQNNEQ